MNNFTRRNFLKAASAVAVTTAAASASPFAIGGATKKVVVIGGGMGGATAAKYIRMMDPSVEVTLIEPKKTYHTGFMSNEVLSGYRSLASIGFGFDKLSGRGVKVVHDWVTGVDTAKQVLMTKSGAKFAYDRCIVSPGIAYKWGAIEGFNAEVADTKIAHAWDGGSQTGMLRKQLVDMKDGGTVIISPPTNPFRCPPGPYERAAQIAMYLKAEKPKSKILVLDPKKKFSKFGLFTAGWKRHYGFDPKNPTGTQGMISWVNNANGGTVTAVDAKNRTVTANGETIKGDVINVIPPQKASAIAFTMGLTNAKGWCPINGKTFESTMQKNIHVIGDASHSKPMPKSGYAANSQAKVCAAAVIALMSNKAPNHPTYVNTCYSVLAPADAISVAKVYGWDEAAGKITKIKGSGGLTPSAFDAEKRARGVEYAHSWFENITDDAWG